MLLERALVGRVSGGGRSATEGRPVRPSSERAVDASRAARVASVVRFKLTQRAGVFRTRDRILDINDEAKEIVQEIGAAINAAVEGSTDVAEAIERLRAAGYEMELTLRLEIGLRERDEEEDAADDPAASALELTDEDRRTLRRMKIRFDEAE